MDKYKFTADYTCDLPDEFWREHDKDIPRCIMPFEVNGVEYYKNDDIDTTEFYELLSSGHLARTSQINQYDAGEKFDKILSEGYDIIHISLSGGITSSVDNFAPTVKTLLAKYPDRKITIIDSLTGSGASGLLLLDGLRMQSQGASYEQVVDFLNKDKSRITVYFLVDDLKYLKHSGRISTIEATIGSMLGIKPLLTMGQTGKITLIGKSRGFKKGLSLMADRVMDGIIPEENDFLFVIHADNLHTAENFGELLHEKTGLPIKYLELTKIVGSHVGKNTIGIAFKGKERF